MPRTSQPSKPENVGPYFGTRVIQLINERLSSATSTYNQRDIAKKIGYPNPNIITMIKQGNSKVPLDRAAKFAEVLEVDPAHFFALTMEQLYPDSESNPIHTIFDDILPTAEEIEMIKIIRAVKGESPKNYRHQDDVAKKEKAARLKEFETAVEKIYAKD